MAVHGSVAATRAENGTHGGVGERGAQVGEAVAVGGGVLPRTAYGMRHYVDKEALSAQRIGCGVHKRRIHGAGRRHYRYLVAVVQGAGCYVHCIYTCERSCSGCYSHKNLFHRMWGRNLE